MERIEIPECSAGGSPMNQRGYGHEGFVKTAPSTQIGWPLMKEDSGPARKTTAWPTSLGNPTRPSGASLDHVAAKSPPSRAVLSTSMAPGATQLTRMPLGASSIAADLVNISMPPLLAVYDTSRGNATLLHPDPMLIIAPPPVSFI